MARSDECVFCKIVHGDASAQIVDRDEATVAFMDINPATRGHLLVIPTEHASDLWELREDQARDVMAAVHRVARTVRDRLAPDGLNLFQANGTVAFQSVFHFHIHVVPRWADDRLVLPWRPAPGDPQEIAAVAAALRGEA